MQNILVTGALSHIGKAICKKANTEKIGCIMVDSRFDELELIKTELFTAFGVNNLTYEIDLSQTKLIDGLMAYIQANDIKLDAFIHCAELSPNMSIEGNDARSLIKTYAVNVFSFIQIAKYVLLDNISLEGASILAMSSVWSKCVSLGRCAYGSSKAALNSAVKNVAKEGKSRSIRANALVLGAVEGSTAKNGVGSNPTMIKHPLGIITPDEVAEYSMYLIGEKGKHITGQDIYMDSGFCIA